jgi:hypothetical protein
MGVLGASQSNRVILHKGNIQSVSTVVLDIGAYASAMTSGSALE